MANSHIWLARAKWNGTLQGGEKICAKARLAAGVDEATASHHRGRSSLWSTVFVHPANPRDALPGSIATKVGPPVSKHIRATHHPPDSFLWTRLLLRRYLLLPPFRIVPSYHCCRPPSEGWGVKKHCLVGSRCVQPERPTMHREDT